MQLNLLFVYHVDLHLVMAITHKARPSAFWMKASTPSLAPFDQVTMAEAKLRVVVDRTDIIITRPGTAYVAVYFKPNRHPYLVAKNAPVGPQEFRTRAWDPANAKARELGWIV